MKKFLIDPWHADEEAERQRVADKINFAMQAAKRQVEEAGKVL